MHDKDVAELIQQNRKIEAIKLYRERMGVGLREARDAVEAIERGIEPNVVFDMRPPDEAELDLLLQQGRKIEAIKLYRDRTGMGLKEAKDAVDALQMGKRVPILPVLDTDVSLELLSLLEKNKRREAIDLYRRSTGFGPAQARQAVQRLAIEHGLQRPPGSGCLTGALLVALIGLLWCLLS